MVLEELEEFVKLAHYQLARLVISDLLPQGVSLSVKTRPIKGSHILRLLFLASAAAVLPHLVLSAAEK